MGLLAARQVIIRIFNNRFLISLTQGLFGGDVDDKQSRCGHEMHRTHPCVSSYACFSHSPQQVTGVCQSRLYTRQLQASGFFLKHGFREIRISDFEPNNWAPANHVWTIFRLSGLKMDTWLVLCMLAGVTVY